MLVSKLLTFDLGDAVPLWNFNIVEAGVTIVCACLFGSKPAIMLLIPDRLVAKMKSIGGYSLRYRRSNLIPRARGVERQTPIGSSPRSEDASPFALRGQPERAARYDLESYGKSSHYVRLDDFRPFKEPAQAIVHNDHGK